MQTPSLPFKVLAFAPFRPEEGSAWRTPPLRVDKDRVEEAMERLGVALPLPLPGKIYPPGGVNLRFRRMKDFHPDGLVGNTPFLNALHEARTFLEEASRTALSRSAVIERLKGWPDLPIEIPREPPKPEPGPSASPVDDLLKMVALPEGVPPPGGAAQPFLAQIDSALEQALRMVFSNEAFRNLESVWRGLSLLLQQGDIDGDISLEIVPVSRETIGETLDRLTPILVEDLPSLLLLDLPIDNSPRALELLEKFSLVAESLMAPALCWISPTFLGLDRWQDLSRLPYLPHYLEELAFAKWRRFRGSSAARWVVVTCNRLLVRYPYGPENRPHRARFEEPRPPWISPVWALACLIGQSVRKTGWPTRFTEWQEVRLEGLSMNALEGNRQVPTETAFSEDRIRQFIQGGITPLVSFLDKDIAFLPGEATVAGGSVAHQLFLSRITRLLFWCKDNFPKDLGPAEVESGLKEAFARFWEQSGHSGPTGLEIAVDRPHPDKPAVARISVDPPRDVLPFGGKIELEFAW